MHPPPQNVLWFFRLVPLAWWDANKTRISDHFLRLVLTGLSFWHCATRKSIKWQYSFPNQQLCTLKGWSFNGLVSLFNGISTLCRLFNAKAILLEEQWWYYLTHSWEDKGVHTFPKDICPKVNVIARLEYELAYYDSAVHRFNHYTTRTTPRGHLIKFHWKYRLIKLVVYISFFNKIDDVLLLQQHVF